MDVDLSHLYEADKQSDHYCIGPGCTFCMSKQHIAEIQQRREDTK